MPGNLKTVFNNGGTPIATSADEFYQRQNLANQSQANEAARLQAMLQDSAANRALQLSMGGSFADKAAQATTLQNAGFTHDTSMQGLRDASALALGKQTGEYNIAGIKEGNMPEFGRQVQHVQEYNDARTDAQPTRDFNKGVADYRLKRLNELTNGQATQPNVMGALFNDMTTAPGPSTGGYGGMFTGAAAAANPQPRGQAQPSAGGGIDDQLMALIDPAGAMADRRLTREHQWGVQQAGVERMNTALTTALQAAAAKGDTGLASKIARQIAELTNGQVPDLNSLGEAYAPSASQAEEIATKNADTAAKGFDFQNSIAEIDALAKDFRNGRAGKGDVMQKADDLVKRLVARQIPEVQAKQMVGQQLDKSLPGLGRDILSAISAGFGGFVEAGIPGLFNSEGNYANVGNASALRTDLKGSGYIR